MMYVRVLLICQLLTLQATIPIVPMVAILVVMGTGLLGCMEVDMGMGHSMGMGPSMGSRTHRCSEKLR